MDERESVDNKVYRCQAVWSGEHCDGDGVQRIVAPSRPASLAGMQLKLSVNIVWICDRCWLRARLEMEDLNG